MPILTAKIGTNGDQFPDILELYAPKHAHILDMTYGEGVFWKKVNLANCSLITNDLYKPADTHHDFTLLPSEWYNTFDVVVFDPPYKLTGTVQRPDQYGNKSGGYKLPDDVYWRGMIEAMLVLKIGGILIVKCMDQVVSGKNEWMHIRIYDLATSSLGFFPEDLFIMVRPNATPQPHETQKHAWKNHSFWWVFRKV